MPLTTVPASMQDATAQYNGFKNRIINGAMVIDQRNAGAATPNTINGYTLDRWAAYQSTPGKYTVQQNAGSVTPPAGFVNYLGVTSSSAYSISSIDQFIIYQTIEGQNISDFAWGTASAAAVTFSFWVRSSLTGTFGGALQNNGTTRNYPFSFTISAANTWEYKTINIPGDTTGTWLTTNGWGVRVAFNLGTGATYSATANAWNGTSFITAPTGAVSVVGTNGATFYITGVQLEKGSTATSFDYRPYGQEFSLCQRYYQSFTGVFSMPYVSTYYNARRRLTGMFQVPMRASPTMTGTFGYDGSGSNASIGANNANNYDAITDVTGGGTAAQLTAFTANAEL